MLLLLTYKLRSQFAFYDKKNITPEKLANSIQSEGIHVILRKSKDGQLYGITYVDHKTQCVFNGSSLGKDFSAKGILERCEQSISYNGKYPNISSSLSPENTQNLASNEYLKTKPIELLMRTENYNDYVPKHIKQKKKRRLRRGI